ncbi:MAG: S-adenosylhomocysteine deaminase, partial [Pseudomonadota bacterium]
MQQVDIIIKNGTILTMDAENSILETGFLYIEGDTISHIGESDEKAFEAPKVIDAKGGLVLPGLV